MISKVIFARYDVLKCEADQLGQRCGYPELPLVMKRKTVEASNKECFSTDSVNEPDDEQQKRWSLSRNLELR